MKNLKLTFLVMAIALLGGMKNAKAQLTLDWFAPNNDALYATRMQIDGAGNVYALIASGPLPMKLTKYSSAGSIAWSVDYALAPTNNWDDKMIVDGGGNAYVAYYSTCDPDCNRSIGHLKKFNPNGVLLWDDTLSDNQGAYEYQIGLAIDISGNVFLGITGIHNGAPNWLYNIDVAKYDFNGVEQWELSSIYFNTYHGVLHSINADQYGNIYVAYDNSSTTTFNLLKLTGSGFFQYDKVVDNSSSTYTSKVDAVYDQSSSSIFYAYQKYINGNDTNLLVRLDPVNNGDILWSQRVSINGSSTDFRIQIDALGNVYWGVFDGGFGYKKYDATGTYQFTVPWNPGGLAFDASGNIYTSGGGIFKYSNTGSLLWTYSDPNYYDGADAPILFNSSNNKIYLVVTDGNNNYGLARFAPCTGVPSMPSAVTTTGGIAKVCPGETRTYSVTNVAGYTFNWTVPAGVAITSGQGTNTITVAFDAGFTVAGSLSVSKVNSCGSSTPRYLTINRNNPTATITTTGPTTFCSGTNLLTLTANAGTGYTYQWQKGTANISGATNQNYVPTTTSTAYKVIVTNAPGCSKTSAGVHVTVNALPAATITPQGPTTFCAGGSVVLQANSGAGLTYQWMKGAANINGSTMQNYTATTAGTYKVKVTNANTCVKTSPGKVVTVNCRESGAESATTSMEVFPNPTNGMITLKFTSAENQNSDLIVTDITGREVMKQQITANEGENEINVDMSNLVKGVYLIRMKTIKEEMIERIVKE